MIKAEIVETNPVYLRGLVAVLTEAGMKVVSARTTFDGLRPWRADILVIDPSLTADPSVDEAITAVARTTPVLALTAGAGCETAGPLSVLYLSGSVSRDADVSELLDTIHTLVRGGGVSPARSNSGTAVPDADSASLSPREQQVLRQIAQGRTHGQIARALGISHHTVDTYVKRIRSKLDLGNKAELTRAAVLGGY